MKKIIFLIIALSFFLAGNSQNKPDTVLTRIDKKIVLKPVGSAEQSDSYKSGINIPTTEEPGSRSHLFIDSVIVGGHSYKWQLVSEAVKKDTERMNLIRDNINGLVESSYLMGMNNVRDHYKKYPSPDKKTDEIREKLMFQELLKQFKVYSETIDKFIKTF